MSIAEILRRGHHQLLRLPQVEAQRTLQAAVLVRLEQAAVAALGDQQLDFVRRVDVPVRLRGSAEHFQHDDAGAVEPLDKRPVDPERRHHRNQRVERRLSGVLQRQRLRDQLRKDHLRHREDEQHHHRRRGLSGDRLQSAPRGKEGLEPHRDGALRVGPQHEARKGDAYLAGGDVAVEGGWRLNEPYQPFGQRVAVSGQLLDPAAPDADRGEFGRDVDRVDRDERQDDEDGREKQRLYLTRLEVSPR